MSTAEVPEWPGYVGWFGAVLGLVWLMEPAVDHRVVPALALLSFACLGYGVYCHLRAEGWAGAAGPSESGGR